ncbi:MAG TPA: hypothetical protein VMN57_17100 [Anaerolineales bacterium]|nr:hypothetical protein [Anaerolineales bacterium]
MKFSKLLPLIFVFLLAACGAPSPAPARTQAPPPSPPTATATAAPTATPTEAPPPEPTATSEPTEPPAPSWPDPVELLEGVIRAAPSDAQRAVGDLLASLVYPEGDFEADLISHGKLDAPVTGYDLTENERFIATGPVDPIPLNSTRTFWISNTDVDQLNEVEFKLLGISENAYFWFDTDRTPAAAQVQDAVDGFEAIVEDIRAIFGTEHPLGIDGDSRVFILHPAATKVCQVTEANAHQCGLGGYFWGVNQYPTEMIWFSNHHEGLIMNYDAYVLGGTNYLDTLTHEYRHLVEFWYRDSAATWEAEGQAVMAEDLLGFRSANIAFANTYMSDPDVQLDTWVSGTARSIFHYGYGYVFSRYLYDRLGEDFFKAWVVYPEGGFEGLDALLAEQAIELTAQQLWLDFLAALVLFGEEGVSEIYTFDGEFAAGLNPVGMTTIPAPPREVEGEVRQFGADIYRIFGDGDVTVTFTGSTLNPLLGRVPASGEWFWYGGRVSSGMRTLTLEADLTGVETATLQYSTYYKFSRAFGFGYVVISTDGGMTWTGLETENMKGLETQDDPYDFALTERFYTANPTGGGWVDETIDLSAYTGQVVLVRWESDSGDRDTGFAIDNVAIPEIGFFDDVETEMAGWSTDGWIRANAYIPQTYHLVLITFEGGVPVVTTIELAEDNTATFDVTGLVSGNAYLVVAATAPQSLQPTAYRIETE